MKMRERLIDKATAAGILAARLIMPMVSDRAVGRLLRMVERLVLLLTGDIRKTVSIVEIAVIFETGPPTTTTIRTIVANMEIDIVAGVLKCGIKTSPYGTR